MHEQNFTKHFYLIFVTHLSFLSFDMKQSLSFQILSILWLHSNKKYRFDAF